MFSPFCVYRSFSVFPDVKAGEVTSKRAPIRAGAIFFASIGGPPCAAAPSFCALAEIVKRASVAIAAALLSTVLMVLLLPWLMAAGPNGKNMYYT
jgi:hypothetical protein